MIEKLDLPYFVYTQERIEQGQSPYRIYGKSAKWIARRFYKRYGINPVKVVSAYWDINKSTFMPDENGEIWKGDKNEQKYKP